MNSLWKEKYSQMLYSHHMHCNNLKAFSSFTPSSNKIFEHTCQYTQVYFFMKYTHVWLKFQYFHPTHQWIISHTPLQRPLLQWREEPVPAKQTSAQDICYEYPCQNPVGSELTTTAKLLLIEMKSQSYQWWWWWWRGPSRRWWRRWRRRWWRWWWHRHPLGFLASAVVKSIAKVYVLEESEGRRRKSGRIKRKKQRGICLYTARWGSAKYLALSRLKTFILHCFQKYGMNSLITVMMTTCI